MESIHIEGSESLPEIHLNSTGQLKISGRALPENAYEFFKPVIAWAKEFTAPSIEIEINLEYFNTSVSRQLHDFLKVLELNPQNKKISLKWFYEEGDDEILEAGEIYEELCPKIKFSYHQYEEVFEK